MGGVEATSSVVQEIIKIIINIREKYFINLFNDAVLQ